MEPSPTTEDRIWAVLAHLSALALGMGILLPIVGWSEQRRKSKYASFQCLQALGYQSLGYTVWLLTYLLMMILFLILLVIVTAAQENGAASGRGSLLWTGAVIAIAFGLIAIYLLLPILAAVACGLGRDFRYPVLGNRLAKYLGYQTGKADEGTGFLIEGFEERWVAAMGHFSVIIALWGLIAPATTWVVQGRYSAFLKFQSIQTTVFQVFVNLMLLAAGVMYFLGIIVLFAAAGLEGGPNMSSPVGMFGILVFFLSLLIAALMFLALPLFHILGQWAGYRLLKGDDYRYPILGKLVEKRMNT
jgi:uncharacterized Tic20 family protein